MGGKILAASRRNRARALFGKNRGVNDFAWGTLAVLVLTGALALIFHLDGGTQIGGRAQAVDGDTIRLGDERIRLAGIDAPEHDQTCTQADGSSWACGKAATTLLAETLRAGGVECNGSERDRYDRLVATCTIAGADLSAAMVRDGLALADWAYKAEEQEARSAGRGIWSGSFQTPRDWRANKGMEEGGWDAFGWLSSMFGH